VARMSLAGIGGALERLYPHLFHPGGDLFSAHLLSIQPQHVWQHPGNCKWTGCMELIDFSPRRRSVSDFGLLGLECLDIYWQIYRFGGFRQDLGGPIQELILPLGDLVTFGPAV